MMKRKSASSPLARKRSKRSDLEIKPNNNESTASVSKFHIYDLNDDCLIAIADYLEMSDLINLSNISIRYANVIIENVIPRKFINFTQLSYRFDISKLFEKFGKALRKFKISGSAIVFKHPDNGEFDEFLQLIQNYCEPKTFREVHIDFKQKSQIRHDLIVQSAPYFENVTNLIVDFKIPATSKKHGLEQWLQTIPKKNLRSLELIGVQPFSDYFQLDSDSAINLESLILPNTRVNATNFLRMMDFFKNQTQLKSLYMIFGMYPNLSENNQIETFGRVHVTVVSKWLMESLPKLKCLHIYGWLDQYREHDDKFKMFTMKKSMEKLVIEIDQRIYANHLLNAYSNRNSTRLRNYIKNLVIICLCPIRGEMYSYIGFLLRQVFDFKELKIKAKGKLIQDFIRSIVRNHQQLEYLHLNVSVIISKIFYQKLLIDRKNVIDGMDTSKPLTIALNEDHVADDLLKSDLYEPNIISFIFCSDLFDYH